MPFNEIQEVDEPVSMLCSFNSRSNAGLQEDRAKGDAEEGTGELKAKAPPQAVAKIPFPKVKSSSVDAREFPVTLESLRKEGPSARELLGRPDRPFKPECFAHVSNRSSDTCPNLVPARNRKQQFPKAVKNEFGKSVQNWPGPGASGDEYLLAKNKAVARLLPLPHNTSKKRLSNGQPNRASHSNRDLPSAQDMMVDTERELAKADAQRQDIGEEEPAPQLSAEPELAKHLKLRAGTSGPKCNFMSMLFQGKGGRAQVRGKQGAVGEEPTPLFANKGTFRTPLVRSSLKFYRNGVGTHDLSIEGLKKKPELKKRA